MATAVVYCCLYVVAVRMDAAVLSYVGRYQGAGAAAAARNADRLPSVASPIWRHTSATDGTAANSAAHRLQQSDAVSLDVY